MRVNCAYADFERNVHPCESRTVVKYTSTVLMSEEFVASFFIFRHNTIRVGRVVGLM